MIIVSNNLVMEKYLSIIYSLISIYYNFDVNFRVLNIHLQEEQTLTFHAS